MAKPKEKIDFTPKKALPPIIKKGQYNFACLQFVYKIRVDKPGGDKEQWIQGNYGAGGKGKNRPNNIDWKLVINDLNGVNDNEGLFECEDVNFYYKKDKRYAFVVRTNSNKEKEKENANVFLNEIITLHNNLLQNKKENDQNYWPKHVRELENWIDKKTAIWY